MENLLLIAIPFIGILFVSSITTLRPRILDPAIVFSFLFILFYSQVYFVSEVILNAKIKHYSVMNNDLYNQVKLFLLMYIFVFFIGYSIPQKPSKIDIKSDNINYVSTNWLVLIMVYLALLVYIQATGGVGSFLFEHRQRVYESQWSTGADQAMENYIRISCGMIFLFAAIYGGYLQGKFKKSHGRRNWAFLLFPLPGTIVRMALISRAFVIFYAVYFLMSELTSRGSRFFYAKLASLIVLAAWGGWTALTLRSASFGAGADTWSPVIALSATAFNAASGVLDSSAFFVGNRLDGFMRVLKELSPVPSFIFSEPYENNLTYLLFGSRTGSSYPMPFIGETFYNLGWFSLLLAGFQGWWCRLVSAKLDFKNGDYKVKWIFIYAGTIYWFLYMHHSGLRSSTRILIWILILSIALRFVYMVLPKMNKPKIS